MILLKLKNLTSIISLILLIACNQSTNNFTLSGEIMNPEENEVRLMFNDTTYTALLDSSNRFVFQLTLSEAEYVRFAHGGENSLLYLMPNSNLDLDINTAEFDETIKLSGTNSTPSSYLLELYLLNENLPWIPEYTHLDPHQYTKKLDSIIAFKSNLLNKYNLPDDFEGIERDKLKYEAKAYKGAYLFYDEFGNYQVPDSFYDFNQNIDFNRSDLISHRGYLDLLYREISTIAKNGDYSYKAFQDFPNFYNDFLAIADSTIQNEAVLSEVVQYHLRGAKLSMDLSDLESHLDRYRPILPSSFSEGIELDIKRLRKILPGHQVPNFTFYTLKGDSTTLDSFKGKLVYIDLWATWCKPCIAEQPMLETLIAQFKNDPIEFISVSIDATMEPWQKMVKEKNLSGTHLYATGDWDAEIMTHFVVMGIPHYILIDEDGKVIDPNTKRPTGGIEELLNEHLRKI